MRTRFRPDIASLRWDMKRFGVGPRRPGSTQAPGAAVFANSIPKAGTHLTERALCLHPGLSRRLTPTLTAKTARERSKKIDRLVRSCPPGRMLVGHLVHDPELEQLLQRHDIATVLTVREPIDVACSWIRFVRVWKGHPAHRAAKSMTDDELMSVRLDGAAEFGIPPLADVFAKYSGWLDAGVYVARFEDLRHTATRMTALRSLWDAVSLSYDDELVHSVADQLVSSASPTYRPATPSLFSRLAPTTQARLRDDLFEARRILGYQP